MSYAENQGLSGDFEPLSAKASGFESAAMQRRAPFASAPSHAARPAKQSESVPLSLAHAIAERLRASPFLPLREVTCQEHEGRVVLRGRVPTQYLQALAATLAKSFHGVREVANKIEVVPLGAPYAPGALREP